MTLTELMFINLAPTCFLICPLSQWKEISGIYQLNIIHQAVLYMIYKVSIIYLTLAKHIDEKTEKFQDWSPKYHFGNVNISQI